MDRLSPSLENVTHYDIPGHSVLLAMVAAVRHDCRRPYMLKRWSVGSQTSVFTANLGTLQHCRSTQGAYQVELERLQHRINFIIAQIGQQELGATERQSTIALQSLQDRIQSITLDKDALDRRCSAETAVGFAQTGSPEKSAKKEQPSLPASREKPLKKRPTSPWACNTASRLCASR